MRLLIIPFLAACIACRSEPRLRVEHLVTPDYPHNAHALNIQGTVTLNLAIGPDGKVLSAGGAGAHPWLEEAAKENVRQWVFGPCPPKGEYPIYHTMKFVYKLEGKPAYVFYYPPVVRVDLPDYVEIVTRPYVDDSTGPRREEPPAKSKGTKKDKAPREPSRVAHP